MFFKYDYWYNIQVKIIYALEFWININIGIFMNKELTMKYLRTKFLNNSQIFKDNVSVILMI